MNKKLERRRKGTIKKKKKKKEGAGEMAQWVRAPDCSSEGQEFKSQHPPGGSQPSVTRDLTPSSGVSEDSYRRGSQILLRMVVSHHVVAGI